MQTDLQINRTIILPIDKEEYNQIIDDKNLYRRKLDFFQAQYPELFPVSISRGFRFVGYSINCKKIKHKCIC